jgi:hypothetical protein
VGPRRLSPARVRAAQLATATTFSTDSRTLATSLGLGGNDPQRVMALDIEHRRVLFDLPLEVLDVHLVGRTLLASAVDGVDLITARVTPIVSHDCMHCRIRLYG